MLKRLCFVLAFTGCTQLTHSGPKKFLVPWMDDASGRYELEEVTLTTLSSPFELKGAAAEIYFQSGFTSDGFAGSVARPHLTQSGDVYIPMDSESLIAVGVYAEMERLYQYEQRMGLASGLTWPRRVGVELNVIGSDLQTHNNAHYYPTLDVMGLLPYSANHVPVSLNHGIVAHEHFHAHFQHEVINGLNHSIDTTISLLESWFYPSFVAGPPLTLAGQPAGLDPQKPATLNNVVMRAWNEGLADLFGGIYTKQPNFFAVTLQDTAVARALNGSSQRMWAGSDFTGVAKANKLSADDFVNIAYFEGTMLSRMLYTVATSGVESPDAFLVRIISKLHNLPAPLNADYDNKVFDMEFIVPILLDGMTLNASACAGLKTGLSPQILSASFAQCAAL